MSKQIATQKSAKVRRREKDPRLGRLWKNMRRYLRVW